MLKDIVLNHLNIKSKLLLIIVYFSCFGMFSQETNGKDIVVESFKEYTKIPRELAYGHLNKSVYIKGETLAFSVYVFDKKNKALSNLTTNLYCHISDDKGKTIKSKLVLVTNGIAQGSFFVDSLFTSGNYTFKAYTNWMKNFDEQNFYIQSIKVIDPDIPNTSASKIITSNLDAQFLPEGGHMVSETQNNIGVIVKDSLGFGVPFMEGNLLNNANQVINSFKTNAFGIGKFSFIPKDNEVYRVAINFNGNEQIFEIDLAESKGITLSVSDLGNRVAIRFSTNNNTIDGIKNKPYKLTIHNGNEFKIIDVTFNEDLEIIKLINYNDLSPGINVFTLFDQNNTPLLERTFFKYDGINFIETGLPTFKKEQDSTLVTIPIKAIDTSLVNSFSISVLPENTKTYNHHHNIISYTLLQPYVKGFVENGNYYFTDITRKKKFELDNLLLTQGWSSYDWNTVFNNPPSIIYNFETGISFKANVNKVVSGQFVMFPISNNGIETFEVGKDDKTFEKTGLFPIDREKIRISEIQRNKSVEKSGLYLQFYPSKIPDLEKYTKILPLKENVYFNTNNMQPLLEASWSEIEQLDEVVLSVKKSETKLEKLKQKESGRVDVFDETKRLAYNDFASYISSKGFRVNQTGDNLTIVNTSSPTPNNNTPLVYLDNMLLSDLSILFNFNMNIVDYIVIDKSGFGAGIRGSAGVIKIFTDPNVSFTSSVNNPFQKIDIPLTFASPTKFYAPKYNFYQSSFYKEYGVIDWLPNCSVDKNGHITFKLSNNQATDIKLFIEGTANNGAFLSEVKTVNFN